MEDIIVTYFKFEEKFLRYWNIQGREYVMKSVNGQGLKSWNWVKH